MPQVINTVTKAAPTDNYPVVKDTDLSGSYRIVANLTERDAIVSTQRKQGMLVFVISDLHFYELQSDLLTWTDLGLSLGGGFAPPIVRCVYLVGDASDAVRMGGSINNTYTTFQAAYDAANTLQILLGGNNIVEIKVGNTIANQTFTITSLVGDLTLISNYNNRVRIVGESTQVSVLGNIIANGFTVGTGGTNLATFSNVSIGNITTSQLNPTGNGGVVSLRLNNARIGNIDTSIIDVTNVTGNGGGVGIQSNPSNLGFSCSIGTIITSSRATTSTAGGLNLSGNNINVGAVTLANNNLGGTIQVNGLNNSISSLTSLSTVTSSGTMTISNCAFNSFNMSLCGEPVGVSGDPLIKFTNCSFSVATISNNGLNADNLYVLFLNCRLSNYVGGLTVTVYAYNTTYWIRQALGSELTSPIVNLGDNSVLFNCTLVKENAYTAPIINGIGTNCMLSNTTLRGGSFSIDNSTPVIVNTNSTYLEQAVGANVTIASNSGSFNPPIARQVYLVNNVSDVARMGGIGNNVYGTAQEAYDAANLLSASGTIPVVIMVGDTIAATVGNITLTADWNDAISIQGINKDISKIGDIIGTSDTNYGFSVGGSFNVPTFLPVYMNNITVGNITTNYTGVVTGAEYSGNVMIYTSNSVIGNINTSINDVADTGSFAGWVMINYDINTGANIPNSGTVVGNVDGSNTGTISYQQTYVANVSQLGAVNATAVGGLGTPTVIFINIDLIQGNTTTGIGDLIKCFMNGNITYTESINWNYGSIQGIIQNVYNASVSFGLSLSNMDYVGQVDYNHDLNTLCWIWNVGQVGVLNITNSLASLSQTNPCTIINTYVGNLTVTNVTFSNISLVSKNLSYTLLNLTKTIHRNFTGTDYILNFVSIDANYNAKLNSSTIGTLGQAYSGDNAKKILTGIVITNSTANAVTGGLNIGTSLGGAQVVSALAVAGNASLYIDDVTILQRIFAALDTSIYISPVTSWNGAILDITLLFSNYK